MRIPIFSNTLSNTRMKTIEEIRRERLNMLKAEYGGVGKLAKHLEKDVSQVSQWLNASINSGTGKERGMSSDQCRYVEEKCDKPRGWMDADPDRVDVTGILKLIALYVQSTEESQGNIMTAAEVAEKLPPRS